MGISVRGWSAAVAIFLLAVREVVEVSLASCEWQLVWEDRFNRASPGDGKLALDTSKWTMEVTDSPHNNELQSYVDSTENVWEGEDGYVFCSREDRIHKRRLTTFDSKLHIRAIRKDYNGRKFTSGRFNSKNKGDWRYGKIVIRAKLPTGKGLWPAFWMLPTDDVFGTWAASGEIDIMEARGQDPTETSGALHYSDMWPYNAQISSGRVDMPCLGSLQSSFHNFELIWEKDWMIWKMDGEQFWQQDLNKSWYVPKSQQAGQQAPQNRYTMNRQPWTERFHLVFNLAVGGWFLDGPDFVSGDYNTSSWSNPEMLVDWVEVFQRADGCQMEGVFPREICGVKESLEASTFCGSVGWACTQPNVECGDVTGDCKERARVIYDRYYQAYKAQGGTCDFSGSAQLSQSHEIPSTNCSSPSPSPSSGSWSPKPAPSPSWGQSPGPSPGGPDGTSPSPPMSPRPAPSSSALRSPSPTPSGNLDGDGTRPVGLTSRTAGIMYLVVGFLIGMGSVVGGVMICNGCKKKETRSLQSAVL